MNIIKRFLLITVTLMFIPAALTPTILAQQKYAVLISAGQTNNDDNNYHSEYWYDLFIMYRMLVEDGFTHNNIFVLYGNGNDFNSNHANYQTGTFFTGIGQITDFPNSKTDVANIFTWLANGNATQSVPQIQSNDFLFYWWMGHGSWDGYPLSPASTQYHADIENTGETIRDDEFAAYFSQLPECLIKTAFVMTCTSGGLIDDMEGLHMMIHTAAQFDEFAQSDLYDVWHAEFSYHVANAFREQDPSGVAVASDVDGDGTVSVEEANVYAHNNTVNTNSQTGDFRNIAPLIYISNAQPAVDVQNQGVYSRDYAEDDGTEPSDHFGHIWYQGPDLWVRHAQDGQPDHQDPEFGQTNYVYARLHNIGCTTLNATAALSWCDVSAWASPASWNAIASIAVNNFESSESREISAAWLPPAPGKYCLHTVLDAPGDPANADGRAYMDNNKVQINVDVKDNYWGYTSNFHWFIENGIKKPVKVDLVISKLKAAQATALELHIPADLKFERISGGRLKRMPEFSEVVIPARTRKVVVHGVSLKPLEKKEAVLSVVLPKEMKLGRSIIVKASEQINGREMGGIIFKSRSASRRKVFTGVLRRTENLFRVLDRKFSVRGAAEIVKLCRALQKDERIGGEGSLKKIQKIIELQAKTRADISKLMDVKSFARFDAALKAVVASMKKQDPGSFVEWQEELIWTSRPIFLKPQR